jgi:hypothetical protein
VLAGSSSAAAEGGEPPSVTGASSAAAALLGAGGEWSSVRARLRGGCDALLSLAAAAEEEVEAGGWDGRAPAAAAGLLEAALDAGG